MEKPSFFERARRFLPILSVLLVGFAVWFLLHILRKHSWNEIQHSLGMIPQSKVILACIICVVSYCILSLYDTLGFKYLHRKILKRQIAFVSFIAFCFSNTIGLANLASSSVRLRLYAQLGVPGKDILMVVLFCSLSFWLGFLMLAGVSFLIFPLELSGFGTFSAYSSGLLEVLGAIFLILVGIYLFPPRRLRRPFRFSGVNFMIPKTPLRFAQIAVASTDWLLVALCLFVLLPESSGLPFGVFLSIFAASHVLALLTHVPGGIGILEALIVYFVSPGHRATNELIASLLAFRAIYYFGPLLIALIALGGFEIAAMSAKRKRNQ